MAFSRSCARCGERSFQPRTTLDYAGLREKLRSEHGPLIDSVAQTTRALADVDKDLEDYEDELHRLQSLIMHMKIQRERLQDYKTRLQSLICPIRRLPNEILTSIFDNTCEWNDLTSGDLVDMPALVLSGVCSRWRHLAQSLPLLWSKIEMKQKDVENDRPHTSLLHLYLEHSAASLLDLIIVTKQSIPPSSELGRALISLVRLKNRWQSLSLTAPDDWSAWLDLTRDSATFPELQHLILASATHTDLAVFQHAPKLHDFATAQQASAQGVFPWSQLGALHIPLYSGVLSTIIDVCTKPKTLTLFVVDGTGDHVEHSVRARHIDTLEDLGICIEGTDIGLAREPFDCITSPSLRKLLIEGLPDRVLEVTNGWPKHSLHDFLLRSSCPLTTLSIKHIPLSDSDLSDLLSLLPSLLYLTVDDSNVSGHKSPLTSRLVQSLHAFRASALRASSTVSKALAPRLRALKFIVSGDNATGRFSDTDFIDMVSSRWLPNNDYASQVEVACLRSLVLRFPDRDADEVVYKPLQYMERAGMRVVIIGASGRL